MTTRFRWVFHRVHGLKLFFDIRYSSKETCTGDNEGFNMKIELPEPVLVQIAGKKIPELPESLKELFAKFPGGGKHYED